MGMSFTKGVTISASETGVDNTKHHNLIDLATSNSDGERSDIVQSTSILYISTTAPTSNPAPINGHLWYDSTNNILMEHDGTGWVPVSRGTFLTNNSGGALSTGDVVVIDSTADSTCKTSTTEGDNTVVGVVLVGAADGSSVLVLTEGYCPQVNVVGATGIGDYLYQSTTGGDADSSASIVAGAFGRAWTSTAGAGNVAANLGGALVVGAGGSKSFTDGGEISLTRSTSSTGSANYAHGMSVAPTLIYATFSSNTGNPPVGQGMAVVNPDGTIQQSAGTATHSSHGGIQEAGYLIYGSEGTSTPLMRGELTSVDDTNITINWTMSGSASPSTISAGLVCLG